MKNFKTFKSDIDFTKSIRILKGRLTKARYKILDRMARKHTQSLNCGCAHDCCGHASSTYMDLIINPNQTKATLIYTVSYNY